VLLRSKGETFEYQRRLAIEQRNDMQVCVCLCLCMYVCVCVCVYVSLCMYVSLSVCVGLYLCESINRHHLYLCEFVYIHTYTHAACVSHGITPLSTQQLNN
jgi:hypothetical protein